MEVCLARPQTALLVKGRFRAAGLELRSMVDQQGRQQSTHDALPPP